MISPKSSLPAYLVVSFLIASTAICHLVRAPPGLGGMFIEQLRSSTIIRFDSQLSARAGRAANRSNPTRNALRMPSMVTWGVGLTIEVTYESPAGLLHDFRTQITVGGLFVKVNGGEGLPPLAEVALVLIVEARRPFACLRG